MGNRLRLLGTEEARARAYSIAESFAYIYHTSVRVEITNIILRSLYATEPFLEDDKLALVARKYFMEGYSPPLVCLRCGGNNYLIDGHHRAYVYLLAGVKMVKSYVFTFEDPIEYVPKYKLELSAMGLLNLESPVSSTLRVWHFMFRTLYWLKRIHGENFFVVLKEVPLRDLVPTQEYILLRGPYSNSQEPILVTKHETKYYIIDGHTRSYVKWLEDRDSSIRALVIIMTKGVLGFVRTSKRMGVQGLFDIKVVRKRENSET